MSTSFSQDAKKSSDDVKKSFHESVFKAAQEFKTERTTDVAALDRILADDFAGVGTNGPAPGKTQLLKNLQPHAGQAPPYTVETSDMHIIVRGDTAVAAYTKTYTAKEHGNVDHEDMTDVFTRDHGMWKLRISRNSSCHR